VAHREVRFERHRKKFARRRPCQALFHARDGCALSRRGSEQHRAQGHCGAASDIGEALHLLHRAGHELKELAKEATEPPEEDGRRR
jgi:hypothetical protein